MDKLESLHALHKTIAQELECPICFGRFQDPRLLDCNHTFCRGCLENCKAAIENADWSSVFVMYVKCGVCRRKTPLDREGVSGLRRDFRTNKLLGVIKEHEVNKDGGADVCETCPREAPGNPVSYCPTCQLAMCRDCGQTHGQLPSSRNHYIVDISRLTNGLGDIEWPMDSREDPHGSALDDDVANRRRASEINDLVEEFTSSRCTCTIL